MIEIRKSKTIADRLLLAGVAVLMALAVALPMLNAKQAHAAVNTWTQYKSANTFGGSSAWGVSAVSNNDVWMVGTNGGVWHYDGSNWVQHDGAGKWETASLIGVSATSANDVWVNGTAGNVWQYNGTTWTQHSGAGKWGGATILGFSSTAANDVWMAANNGNIWRYNGTTWSQQSGSGRWGTTDMQTVSARTTSDVWVAGFDGQVWHYDGSNWVQHDGAGKWMTNDIRDIKALAANDVWMATWGGGTWHYDGNTWTKGQAASAVDLDASSADNVWLATLSNGVWGGSNTPIGFTNPTNKSVVAENTRAVTDLQLTGGSASDVVNLNLAVDDGSLAFGSMAGLTFTGSTTGSSLQFSGTKNAINAALLTLVYTAPSTTGTYKFDALINDGSGTVFWSTNGHAYKVVTPGGAGISWDDANTAAQAQTFGGAPGYLATVTSQPEHDFILTRIDQSGWIGANDKAVEGEWRWVSGPEAGQQFWQGNAATGHAIGGMHTNWGANEPNNGGGSGEDCAQIRFTPTIFGSWNDLDCGTLLPNYVVEFGAPGALPTVTAKSFNFNVTPITYTLSFDTQGGTNINPITGLQAAQNVTIPAAPVQSGYMFDGWNTAADGSGTDYAPGASFAMPASATTLYAQWKQDGNVNEVPDGDEPNVYNYTDPATGHDVTMVVDASCDPLADDSMARVTSNADQDADYTYPTGFVKFKASGCDDDKTNVELYYHDTPGDNLVLRKYNPSTHEYFNVADVDSNATVTRQVIGGKTLVVAKFTVADGSRLDVDGKKDGTITDPVGLGILATTNDSKLASTGEPIQVAAITGTILALAGIGGLLLYRKRALTRP